MNLSTGSTRYSPSIIIVETFSSIASKQILILVRNKKGRERKKNPKWIPKSCT
jgi:hypothetical protein